MNISERKCGRGSLQTYRHVPNQELETFGHQTS